MFSEYELNILQNANICTKDGWYEIIQNLSSARYSNYVPSTYKLVGTPFQNNNES